MIKHRPSAKRRPFVLDFVALEDRAVPSTGAAQVADVATSGNTAASVDAQLTQFGSQANTAYSTFATAIRQAEVTYYTAVQANSSSTGTGSTGTGSTGTGSTGTGSTGTGSTTTDAQALSALKTSITSAVNTLQGSITSALSVLPGSTGTLQTLLQAELTGAGSSSVAGQLNALVGAATASTTDGSTPTALFPLLFSAVENVISSSYSTTAVNVYYYGVGQITPGNGSTGSGNGSTGNGSTGNGSTGNGTAFDLGTVGAQENAAFNTFATSLYQSQGTLVGTTSNGTTTAPTGTPASVTATVTQSAATLSQSLTSAFAATPAANNVGLLTGQLNGTSTGALAGGISSLLTAGTVSGSIPQSALPLLFTAVDDALEAAYSGVSVNTYLLATSPSYLQATGTGN